MIPNLARMGEEDLETLLQPRATGSASAAYEAPCIPFWGRTIFTAYIKQAHSNDGKSYQQLNARYHYDTNINDRILSMGKSNDAH